MDSKFVRVGETQLEKDLMWQIKQLTSMATDNIEKDI